MLVIKLRRSNFIITVQVMVHEFWNCETASATASTPQPIDGEPPQECRRLWTDSYFDLIALRFTPAA